MRIALIIALFAGTMTSFVMIIKEKSDEAGIAFIACLVLMLGTIAQGAYLKWSRRRRVWRHGQRTTATVLTSSQAGANEFGIRARLRVRVTAVDGDDFEAMCEGSVAMINLHAVQPGRRVTVAYHPKARHLVVLDPSLG